MEPCGAGPRKCLSVYSFSGARYLLSTSPAGALTTPRIPPRGYLRQISLHPASDAGSVLSSWSSGASKPVIPMTTCWITRVFFGDNVYHFLVNINSHWIDTSALICGFNSSGRNTVTRKRLMEIKSRGKDTRGYYQEEVGTGQKEVP
jgi:hypothetical protein